jgi:hypothetical protein
VADTAAARENEKEKKALPAAQTPRRATIRFKKVSMPAILAVALATTLNCPLPRSDISARTQQIMMESTFRIQGPQKACLGD